jgi:hypothetical protein
LIASKWSELVVASGRFPTAVSPMPTMQYFPLIDPTDNSFARRGRSLRGLDAAPSGDFFAILIVSSIRCQGTQLARLGNPVLYFDILGA